MKILGKYKDYYDYLQGIYGVDPMQVFDRRYENMVIRKPEDEDVSYPIGKRFFVAGKSYDIYYYNDKSYYTLDEMNELNKIFIKKKKVENCISMSWKYIGRNKWHRNAYYELTQEWWDDIQGKKSDVNVKLRNPVLMSKIMQSRNTSENYSPCILGQWDFHKVMPPEEAYREISSMISYFVDHPEIPNKQSNREKIQSHGFDLKKSFRHRNNSK